MTQAPSVVGESDAGAMDLGGYPAEERVPRTRKISAAASTQARGRRRAKAASAQRTPPFSRSAGRPGGPCRGLHHRGKGDDEKDHHNGGCVGRRPDSRRGCARDHLRRVGRKPAPECRRAPRSDTPRRLRGRDRRVDAWWTPPPATQTRSARALTHSLSRRTSERWTFRGRRRSETSSGSLTKGAIMQQL